MARRESHEARRQALLDAFRRLDEEEADPAPRARAFRGADVAYWRPRRPNEPQDADARAAQRLDRYWRKKYGESILALLDVAPVAHAAQLDATRARLVTAARVAPPVRRTIAALRRELARAALPGRARAGAVGDLLARERLARARDPAYGRAREALPVQADVQRDVETLIAHMEYLVEHQWVSLLTQAGAPRGTKAEDAAWNAAAAAVRGWIRARLEKDDDRDAVAALEFLGWEQLAGLDLAVQKARVKDAARRHEGGPRQRRHVPGFSRRSA